MKTELTQKERNFLEKWITREDNIRCNAQAALQKEYHYYVVYQTAGEEESTGIACLTNQEYSIVNKFLDQVDESSNGYAWDCHIDEKAFDTKDEAKKYIHDQI